jgi:hypothetical protein
MPKGRAFDVMEKAKIMAWFHKGVAKRYHCQTPQDCQHCGKSHSQKQEPAHGSTPPPPRNGLVAPVFQCLNRRRDCKVSFINSNSKWPERSRRRWRASMTCLLKVSSVFTKKKLRLLYCCACQEAASDGQDGQETAQLLEETPLLDIKIPGMCDVQ